MITPAPHAGTDTEEDKIVYRSGSRKEDVCAKTCEFYIVAYQDWHLVDRPQRRYKIERSFVDTKIHSLSHQSRRRVNQSGRPDTYSRDCGRGDEPQDFVDDLERRIHQRTAVAGGGLTA